MLSALLVLSQPLIIIQEPKAKLTWRKNPFVVVDEQFGKEDPISSVGRLYVLELRIVGRGAKVILDTTKRAMPYQHEFTNNPESALDFGVRNLPSGASRVFANPEQGTFYWLRVIETRPFRGS